MGTGPARWRVPPANVQTIHINEEHAKARLQICVRSPPFHHEVPKLPMCSGNNTVEVFCSKQRLQQEGCSGCTCEFKAWCLCEQAPFLVALRGPQAVQESLGQEGVCPQHLRSQHACSGYTPVRRPRTVRGQCHKTSVQGERLPGSCGDARLPCAVMRLCSVIVLSRLMWPVGLQILVDTFSAHVHVLPGLRGHWSVPDHKHHRGTVCRPHVAHCKEACCLWLGGLHCQRTRQRLTTVDVLTICVQRADRPMK